MVEAATYQSDGYWLNLFAQVVMNLCPLFSRQGCNTLESWD